MIDKTDKGDQKITKNHLVPTLLSHEKCIKT